MFKSKSNSGSGSGIVVVGVGMAVVTGGVVVVVINVASVVDVVTTGSFITGSPSGTAELLQAVNNTVNIIIEIIILFITIPHKFIVIIYIQFLF
jgi:hypothetical protein